MDRRAGRKSILDYVPTNFNCVIELNLINHCIFDHRILDICLIFPLKLGAMKQTYNTKIVNFHKFKQNMVTVFLDMNSFD